MIRYFLNESGRLQTVDGMPTLRDDLVWIDLFKPTAAEEAEVEKLIGLEIPTREDMQAIELSSRLYEENGASYMTATLPAHMDGDEPDLALIIRAWSRLPEALRAGIAAMVRAAGG